MYHHQRHYCEHLALRKPTKVDELVSSVEKPRGSVPKHGMPLWSQLLLDAKLPVLTGPKSMLAFSRNKLGRKLWHTTARTEFLLSDPNCLDVSYHYEALHDENLRNFFKRKANQKQIKELGLVDQKGEAICSLKDYNEYRRYLKRVQVDAINRERSRREAALQEECTLGKAHLYLQKDLAYQIRYAERMENMKLQKVKMAEDYRKRREGWLDSMRANTQRLKEIAQRTHDDNVRRAHKIQALTNNVHARVSQGKHVARKKMLKTLKKWTEGDAERRKTKLASDKKRLELGLQREIHHWQMKVDFQKIRIMRERRVLAEYAWRMNENVHNRNVATAKQRAIVEDVLTEIKMKKVQKARGKSKLYTTDHMVNAFLKAWEAENNGTASVEDKRKIVASLMLQLAEAKNKPEGKEVLSLLQEAKQKLDRERSLPEPVTCAINDLLTNVIEQYVRQNIEAVITTVAEKAEGCTEQLEKIIQDEARKRQDDGSVHSTRNRNQSVQSNASTGGRGNFHSSNPSSGTMLDHSTYSSKRMSVVVAPGEIVFLPSISDTSIGGAVHSHHSGKMSPAQRRHSSGLEAHNPAHRYSGSGLPRATRIVSFGRITTVKDLEGMKEQTSDTANQYLKIKDRPPTPVPSLNEIVDAVFKETVLLDRDEHSAHLEKENLDKLFLQLSKTLLSIVLGKALKEMQIRHKSSSFKYFEVEPMNKTNIAEQFTQLILGNPEVNFNECSEVNFVSDEIVRMMIVKKRQSSLSVIPEVRSERRSSTKSTERRQSNVAKAPEEEKRNSIEDKVVPVSKPKVKF